MSKFDAWIIRSLGVCVPIMIYLFIDIKTQVQHLDDVKSEKINTLTGAKYCAVENGQSNNIADLFVDFGKMINLKDEDLELFRTTSVRKLKQSIKIGTVRGS